MELQPENPNSPEFKESKLFVRFLSNESNSQHYSTYKILQIPQWKYSFKSVGFLFKVAQLVSIFTI